MANYDFEIESLRQQVARIEEKLKQKGVTLYGNGSEGITSRMNGVEEDVEVLKAWRDKWMETTNVAEFIEMRKKLAYLSSWNYLIVGGVGVITLVIQVVVPRI